MNIKYILISLVLSNFVYAQFSPNLEISTYYDDNLFRSPYELNDLVSDIDLKLNYQIPNSNLHLYYNPDIILFNNYSERNFSLHGIGLSYFKDLNEEESRVFYLGAEYNKRINKSELDFYNYNQFYGYANMRFDLNLFFLKLGYNYRYRDYMNFSDLTNSRQYIFAQINKALPSRTSIILEADLGRKSFAGSKSLTSVYEDYNSYTQGRGKGRGATGVVTDTNYTSVTQTFKAPSLDQFVLLARVAQSLHPKVGIYIQYRKQISLTEQTTYLNSDAYFQDEEIFDDPFSYESDAVSSQLTWIFPWVVKFQLGASYSTKNYISEQAYTSELDSLASGGTRQDDRSLLYLNLSKSINFNKNWLNAVTLNFNYHYARNESNSYWYDYKNSVIGGGIEWKF